MANFTPYKLASGKVVNIPTAEIQRNMALLKISRDEAVDLWLYDNEYIGNEEADALTNKAKENRITATIHQAKAEYKQKTQRERVKKDDPTKEGIIKAVAEMLPSLNAENIEIVNAGKLITFTIGADKYKLDLIRQRPPKTKG